jgi:hypothetical protein
MIAAAATAPLMSAPLEASGLRADLAAASFLQILEEEMLREAVPTSLPPPTFPLPVPGPLVPDYPWVPLPLILLPPRDERLARTRPPARRDKRPERRQQRA